MLKNIIRRKHSTRINSSYLQTGKHEEFDDEEVVMEIARLKEEQKALEEEVAGMNKRLEATERRPQQMMAFLYKVAEDPHILSRVLHERDRSKQLGEKKRRLISAATSSSSSSGMAGTSSVKTEVDDEEATVGGIISSSPEAGFEIDNFCQSSPPPQEAVTAIDTYTGWRTQREAIMSRPRIPQQAYNSAVVPTPLTAVMDNTTAMSPPLSGGYSSFENSNGHISYFTEMAAGKGSSPPPPYPFSLLEGGF